MSEEIENELERISKLTKITLTERCMLLSLTVLLLFRKSVNRLEISLPILCASVDAMLQRRTFE